MDMKDYLRILRSRWIGVLAFLLAGIAVSAGWTLLQPRVYTAHASGYVAAPGESPRVY